MTVKIYKPPTKFGMKKIYIEIIQEEDQKAGVCGASFRSIRRRIRERWGVNVSLGYIRKLIYN